MEYKTPAEARDLPGLRIALTAGVPGPWSMAARFFFDVKGIDYVPVLQQAGQDNEDLVAWTGHRNAPVVVLDDEAPRTNWADILELAERLNPTPRLVPADAEQRVRMFGLANEIAGAGGLLWAARHVMLAPMMQMEEPPAMATTMAKAYGYSEEALAAAPAQVKAIFDLLAAQLEAQEAAGSRYFIGDSLTALDIIWACFSNPFATLPEEVNPMGPMRRAWAGTSQLEPVPDILIRHRDYIFETYIGLPLDF